MLKITKFPASEQITSVLFVYNLNVLSAGIIPVPKSVVAAVDLADSAELKLEILSPIAVTVKVYSVAYSSPLILTEVAFGSGTFTVFTSVVP